MLVFGCEKSSHTSSRCRLPGCLSIYQADFPIKIETEEEITGGNNEIRQQV